MGRTHLEPTTTSICVSPCYVSIKQLDSSSQRQFQISCSQQGHNPADSWDKSDARSLTTTCRRSREQAAASHHKADTYASPGATPSSPWSQCFSRSYASILPTS